MSPPWPIPKKNSEGWQVELDRVDAGKARHHLFQFVEYTYPDYQSKWFHRYMADKLTDFSTGKIKRLMIFMPPQHGKSELVSRRLPAYILGRYPDARVIGCSYAADLASRFNRDVQRVIDSPQYKKVFPDTALFGKNIRSMASGTYLRNSDIFEIVNYKGSYRGAGIGQGITGMSMDFGIIDDPVKDAEQALSPTYRQKMWEWYTSTFMTRAHADTCILLTMTRWHHDDLAGRLLKLMQDDPLADKWEVIRFPALKEPGGSEVDPRSTGDALWSEKFPIELLGKFRANDVRNFESLYQQNPTPRSGGMFKQEWFKIAKAIPSQIEQRVRYWDRAATEGAGDYTVGLLMGRSAERDYYIEDVVRGRWSPFNVQSIIKQTAQLDAEKYGQGVVTVIEEEGGHSGKESAATIIKLLAGYRVETERPSGSKEVRAEPFSAQCEAGNVYLLAGEWNKAYIDELTTFPYGSNDDQTDTSSGAFNKLALGVRPVFQSRVVSTAGIYG